MANDADRNLADLARAALLGAVVGGGLVIVFIIAGWSRGDASDVAFSLSALVFGFGLTVWASTVLLSESLAGMHTTLDREWSAADTRRAMAVLTVLGAAGMVSASIMTILLGG
ncbi:DUF7268 family protein [Halalkalicoccus jeotgali]|uniref:Uncharacterized protein n=1 Tax=Halalkalicoccus jeotgali (strain DSM 18796 / CECT 7217 / JCM 14584 / KCTC 4019 / B3) TaxID=795797 RepID=D8J6K2_HALJB|nr:hypothetical protein [Halalkalicoccus jeotgali]ADJ13879.1 hypothetical protein HacjB3_02430 [Halalkalicoccus jeotgali B3]ELY34074.1 hypothetical protein C497_16882 [Halalkalicoccus jeotgali B3]